MTQVATFEAARGRLFAVAYRMLGSAAEAEDAVQDTYLRWANADTQHIENAQAWLTKVLTNLCLTRLGSARARREAYPGTWLPEPVHTGPGADVPADVERADSVSLAMLVLLERLTPAQRAVFVLREAFDYPHAEIAEVLDISPTNSAQLYRRARSQLDEHRQRFEPSTERARLVVERFLDAARGGDLGALERLLAEDVTATADGGGRLPAARNTITGADKVARYLLGTLGAVGRIPTLEVRIDEVNGSPTALAVSGNYLLGVVSLDIWEGSVVAVHVLVNPAKLRHIAAQLALEPADDDVLRAVQIAYRKT